MSVAGEDAHRASMHYVLTVVYPSRHATRIDEHLWVKESSGLAGAGFAGASVTFTHEAAPGLHSAVIRAVKPS